MFKTMKMSGIKTRVKCLSARHAQYNWKSAVFGLPKRAFPDRWPRRTKTLDEVEKAAVRPVKGTGFSDNILRLIIIYPRLYSFENLLNRTQSYAIKSSRLLFNLVLFLKCFSTISSI